jgi:hypothetical protein
VDNNELRYNSRSDWKRLANCGIVLAIMVGGLLAYLIRLLP